MASYGGLPDFSTFLVNHDPVGGAPDPASTAPQASGTGNFLTAGLGSGFHGALANVGGFGEAVARATGFDNAADAAAQYADSERAAAATYARPDLEAGPWYSPTGLGYRLAQMAPGAGIGLLGAGAAALAAPEEAAAAGLTGLSGVIARHAAALGGAAATFPLVTGENVQRSKDYNGDLSQGAATKALLFGVPEAALQGVLPGKLEGLLGGAVGQGLGKTVRNTAIAQLPIGAATEYLTQEMGDPNRSFADRAQDIVNAALQGAVLGGAAAGVVHPISSALHAISKTPVANVQTGGLFDLINRMLNPVEPSAPRPPVQLAITDQRPQVPQLQAPQFFSGPRIGEQPEDVSRVPSGAAVTAGAPGDRGSRPIQEDIATPLLEAPQFFAGERLQRGLTPDERAQALAEQNNRVPSEAVVQAGPPSTWRNITDATEQPPLSLEQIKAQNAANSNQPPTDRPPTTPQDLVARLRDPTDPLFKAGGGVNENQPQLATVREPTPQKPLELPKPGAAPVANPSVERAPTPQPPVKGPITTREGLRKAGLANVEVGREATNAPANRNVEGPGATREATAQDELLKPASGTKPANDTFDQTPLQADLNKVPEFRGKQFKTQNEIEDAVAKSINDRDANSKPVPPALERVAKSLGIMGADGALVGRHAPQDEARPEGPHETLEAGPQSPEAPPRDSVPAQHQGRFDRLQELRDSLGDNLNDPETFGLIKRATDLQNELANVKGSQRTGQINREITTLRGDIESRARVRAEPPVTDPRALASSTKPTPDAQAFVQVAKGEPQTAEARAKAQRAGKAPKAAKEAPATLPENIPAVNPTDVAQDAEAQARMTDEGGPAPREAPEPAPTQEATRKATRKAASDKATVPAPPEPKVVQDATPEAPPTPSTALPARKAKAHLDAVPNAEAVKRQKNESQTTQAVEAEIKKPTPKTPLTPEIQGGLNLARQSLEELKKHPPEGVNAARIAFNKNIAAHEKQLAVLEKAAKEGGLEALQNFRRDHFDDNLWSDALGKLSSTGEAALTTHATHETYLMDQIAGLRGERPLIRYATQPTVHDVNLAHVIQQTGKTSDALRYIAENDPSPMNRLMASMLNKLGLDTSIRMASDEHLLEDTSRKLGEGEIIAASHNDQLNRISIYDGGNVARSVLHEAFHAATVRALKAGSAAARDLVKMFDRLKARAGDQNFYGLSNAEEMVAEAGSNPTFQQFLKSEPWQVNGIKDAWQAFKNGVFKALGMDNRVRTAFDQIMDGTQKLMAENPTRAAITGDRPLIVERGVKAMSEARDILRSEAVSRLAREAEGLKSSLIKNVRDGVLGWVGGTDIGHTYVKPAPTLLDYSRTLDRHDTRKDTMFKTAVAAMHKLEGLSKDTLDTISRLMARTIQGLDPFKPWKEHTHLLNHPNAKILEQEHADAVKDVDRLRRLDKGAGLVAYAAMRSENVGKYSANNVRMMYEHARSFAPELLGAAKGFETDPFNDYEKAYTAHDDPHVAEKFWKAREADMRQSLKGVHSDLFNSRDKLTKQAKADDKLPKDQRLPTDQRKVLDDNLKSARDQFKQLNEMLSGIDRGNEAQAQSPYFHVGRDGEHFVSAYLKSDANGIVDPKDIAALRDKLDAKGFKDVAVMQGLTNDHFYARLGSETERREMYAAMQELQKSGNLSETKAVTRGLASDEHVFQSLTPAHMQELVAAAKANRPDIPAGATTAQRNAINDAHDEHVRELMRSMVQLIPQTGLNRLYQFREGVQGFSKNMIQGFRSSSINNSAGLSNLSLATETGEKMAAMRDQIKALNADPDIKESQLTSVTQAYNEMLGRKRGVQSYSTTKFMDAIRQAGHLVSVGMSPVYVMTLLGQTATLSHPELAKYHGFVESAGALARATNPAFQLTSAVARGPDAATFGLRHETLTKAGMSPENVEFHMDMARRGAYSQGYTEAMTGHEASTAFGKAKHYANSMGRYAEMYPRAQLAIAARDLYNQAAAKFAAIKAKNPNASPPEVLRKFATANDYAQDAVEQAQLNWGSANTARQLTRGGVFGVMSPLINQFMGFQTRMSAKLYREVHGALGGDKQSQRWLLSHAAATATLAGTLGLPMVSVAASVYDKLADWATGEDNHDVIASYRTFLASAFGKEVGEVIARGAPRAIGVDFSHAGEGAILPGSSTVLALTEKRKLEDAEKDWLKSEAGHPVNFMFHMAAAVRDIANGDYLDASEKLVPEVFKGPLEAYRLEQRNFVDKNGQKLPITANATDIMMTAMGIDPAKEAEYNEEQRTATGLNAMRQARSQNITRHLLLAQSRGDAQMFQDWERQATQFQLDHPGMAGPLQDFGRSLSQHMRADATARGFGTPLGVKPRDIIGRGMASFGNLRNN